MRAMIRAELRALLAPILQLDEGPEFYPRRKGRGPSWLDDREWMRLAPTLPGYFVPKKNGKPGRFGFVPRASVEAYRASLSASPPPPANDSAQEPWTPQRALASAGLRGTR